MSQQLQGVILAFCIKWMEKQNPIKLEENARYLLNFECINFLKIYNQ